jgi:hypothetical protein
VGILAQKCASVKPGAVSIAMPAIRIFYEAISQSCHSEQREDSLQEILYGVYPERSRRVQGDNPDVPIS